MQAHCARLSVLRHLRHLQSNNMNHFVYLGLIWLGLIASIPGFFISDNSYKKQHLNIFIILLIISILESYGTYTTLNGINNVWAFNIVFVYLETLLLLYFFTLVFNDPKFARKILILSAIFVLWGVINTIWIQTFDLLQTYSFIMGSFLIIGCCVYYFYKMFDETFFKDQSLLTLPSFWVITFVFFFYACSFLFFASIRLMDESNYSLLIGIYDMIRVLGVLMYMIMGLAFYAPLIFKKKVIV